MFIHGAFLYAIFLISRNLHYICINISCLYMSKLSKILKSNAVLPLAKQCSLNLICSTNFLAEKFTILFKSHQITNQQYNVLRILRGQKGTPVNLSTIQERMVHKSSNTSRIIDKLLIKGFVERKQCEENRRKIELLITKSGLAKLISIDPDVDKLEGEIFKKISIEEAKLLNELLEKLRT